MEAKAENGIRQDKIETIAKVETESMTETTKTVVKKDELLKAEAAKAETVTVDTETTDTKAKAEEAPKFDKDLFKRSVDYNVKTLYRKDLAEATPRQIFQAASLAIKDRIIGNWMDTRIPRWCIICPWNSLWAGPWATA